MSTYLKKFSEHLDQVLKLLVTGDTGETKETLMKSIYMDMSGRLLSLLKNLNQDQAKILFSDLKSMSDLDFEDESEDNLKQIEVKLTSSKELIDSLDIDYDSLEKAACEVVMVNFIESLSQDLSQSELEKLKTIFE